MKRLIDDDLFDDEDDIPFHEWWNDEFQEERQNRLFDEFKPYFYSRK